LVVKKKNFKVADTVCGNKGSWVYIGRVKSSV